MIELCGMMPEEITELIADMGQSAFRGKQVLEWVNKGVAIENMSNLSAAFRTQLSQRAVTNSVKVDQIRTSKIDGTEKFLFALSDGHLVEGVLMRYKHGATLCLSTQVGCRMGCAFCASTLDGCARNLTPGEMVGQVLNANEHLAKTGERVHNLVLMGSGEPLDNYDNVVKFLRLITDERMLNLSNRAISLSTCGLVDQMDRFSREGIPVTLSLSLHAPNDVIRAKLMPIARVHTIDKTLAACKRYIEKTGRRIIIEYAMVDGLNSSVDCAIELASRLRGMQCHVNVIPLNAIAERPLQPPPKKQIDAFMEKLTQLHISVTRRREMGDDIEGACGQLRRREVQNRHG